MALQAEFTIEPFTEGAPGPHVVAALQVVDASGLDSDFGPFGTTITGEAEDVIRTIAEVLDASVAQGATRISLQVSVPYSE